MIDLPKITPTVTPTEIAPIDNKSGVKPVPVDERIPTEVKKTHADRRKNLDRRRGRDKKSRSLMESRHRDRRRGSIDIKI